MEAYQYKIRKEKSKTENIEFSETDVNLNNTEIKVIDKPTAKKIIEEYEWLGTMPQITKYHFGIYFKINEKSYLGGVLTFGDDYAANTGVWDKYGYEDKILLLNRGVCLWWTPKNTASFFISRVCKWLKKNTKYRIITATIDPMAGEVGIIYQSLNWHYVGLMSGNYNNNKESKRFSVLIDGKLRQSRWVRNKFGTMKKEVVLKHHPDAIFIPQYRKRRYFYFMDTPTMNRKHLKAIKHLLQPYPKKNTNTVGVIYQITNKINQKKYVGQTTRSFISKINDYKKWLGNDYLNNAIKKYGWDCFEFKIIDSGSNLDELNNKEIYYINKFKTTNKSLGYNIEVGGRNSIPPIETIEKMSRSHLGKKQNDEWVNKRIALAGSPEAKKYGRKKTEEEKKLIGEKSPKYWLGKKRDSRTIEKISKTKKERGLSDKQKELLCKKVFVRNAKTHEIIETFDSTSEAGHSVGKNQSTISRWCNKKKVVHGKIWSYI